MKKYFFNAPLTKPDQRLSYRATKLINELIISSENLKSGIKLMPLSTNNEAISSRYIPPLRNCNLKYACAFPWEEVLLTPSEAESFFKPLQLSKAQRNWQRDIFNREVCEWRPNSLLFCDAFSAISVGAGRAANTSRIDEWFDTVSDTLDLLTDAPDLLEVLRENAGSGVSAQSTMDILSVTLFMASFLAINVELEAPAGFPMGVSWTAQVGELCR